MTDAEKQKLIKKMDRCAKSLSNVCKRYRTICQSNYGVVDRYDDTRDEMIQAELWAAWCQKNGKAFGHRACDYFA